MNIAPIIFLQSFQSHCPTVGPNLTLAFENYLWWSDHSLTLQTTADYLRLLFFPDASSPTTRFFIRFSIQPSDPPISRAMGRRLRSCWEVCVSGHELLLHLYEACVDLLEVDAGPSAAVHAGGHAHLWHQRWQRSAGRKQDILINPTTLQLKNHPGGRGSTMSQIVIGF